MDEISLILSFLPAILIKLPRENSTTACGKTLATLEYFNLKLEFQRCRLIQACDLEYFKTSFQDTSSCSMVKII